MIECDSDVEAAFREAVGPKLDKLHAAIVMVHHDERMGVLQVTIALPQWADRSLRHEVLEQLASFEDEQQVAVIVSPTFVAATDA